MDGESQPRGEETEETAREEDEAAQQEREDAEDDDLQERLERKRSKMGCVPTTRRSERCTRLTAQSHSAKSQRDPPETSTPPCTHRRQTAGTHNGTPPARTPHTAATCTRTAARRFNTRGLCARARARARVCFLPSRSGPRVAFSSQGPLRRVHQSGIGGAAREIRTVQALQVPKGRSSLIFGYISSV